jgi:hypothetical protein
LQNCFVNWGKHDAGWLEKMRARVDRDLGCRAVSHWAAEARHAPRKHVINLSRANCLPASCPAKQSTWQPLLARSAEILTSQLTAVAGAAGSGR